MRKAIIEKTKKMSEESKSLLDTQIQMPNKIITTAEAVKIALPLIQKLVVEGFTLKNIQDQVSSWGKK